MLGWGDFSRRTFLPPLGPRQAQSCCSPPWGLLPAALRDGQPRGHRQPGQGQQCSHGPDRDVVKCTCLWLLPVSLFAAPKPRLSSLCVG